MKNVAMVLALATTAVVAAGCHRTENPNASNTANDHVRPTTATSTSTPPPLPATPSMPTGTGTAEPATSPAPAVQPTGTPVTAGSGTPDGKASDTAANNPTGSLTKSEESNEMPKAGQVNNHSSTSMEESRGQTPQK